jgi:tetratricopeptide (TPR) repeat protein
MRAKLLILIILASTFASAQSLNFTKLDREINNLVFNAEWQKADSILNDELSKGENLTKLYFFKAYTHFYARYLSNTAPSRDSTIMFVKHYAWKAVEAGEEKEESLENMFYLGCAYGFLARANIMSGEYWDGYWNASKSENYFEDVLEADPNISDAYLGLAVIEYFPEVGVSGFTSFLAWLGGMSGDREAGLKYFNTVSNSGRIFDDEAKYILGLIYGFRENDNKYAYENWKSLSDKYPDNNQFTNRTDQARLAVLIDEKGVEFLNSEIDSLAEKYFITNAGVLNTMGYNLINQNRLEEALVVFQANMKLYPQVANCYDSLAECYMNLGNDQKAIEYYQMAYDKIPQDTTATEEFKEFLRTGIEERLADLRDRVAS